MTLQEANTLDYGVYIIYWKMEEGGGCSLASVGGLHNGDRWLAPTNWTSPMEITFNAGYWDKVEKAELILSNRNLIDYKGNKSY